jgi:hypothetical protein
LLQHHIVEVEQMMAHLLTKIRTNQEMLARMEAKIETNADTNMREMTAEIRTNQERVEAKIEANNEKFEVLRGTLSLGWMPTKPR